LDDCVSHNAEITNAFPKARTNQIRSVAPLILIPLVSSHFIHSHWTNILATVALPINLPVLIAGLVLIPAFWLVLLMVHPSPFGTSSSQEKKALRFRTGPGVLQHANEIWMFVKINSPFPFKRVPNLSQSFFGGEFKLPSNSREISKRSKWPPDAAFNTFSPIFTVMNLKTTRLVLWTKTPEDGAKLTEQIQSDQDYAKLKINTPLKGTLAVGDGRILIAAGNRSRMQQPEDKEARMKFANFVRALQQLNISIPMLLPISLCLGRFF